MCIKNVLRQLWLILYRTSPKHPSYSWNKHFIEKKYDYENMTNRRWTFFKNSVFLRIMKFAVFSKEKVKYFHDKLSNISPTLVYVHNSNVLNSCDNFNTGEQFVFKLCSSKMWSRMENDVATKRKMTKSRHQFFIFQCPVSCKRWNGWYQIKHLCERYKRFNVSMKICVDTLCIFWNNQAWTSHHSKLGK